MDNFFSGNSDSSSNDSNKWSEKAWLEYVKRSDAEISKLADAYESKRRTGMGFEEIALVAGWPVAYTNADIMSGELPDFSNEPLTLINHPIYIVSRAIILVLERNIESLVEASNAHPVSVWKLAKSVSQASSLIMLAVNSTDLGEDMLAHSIYKSAISCLNTALAEVEHLQSFNNEYLAASREMAISAVFDLRQICLNLS